MIDPNSEQYRRAAAMRRRDPSGTCLADAALELCANMSHTLDRLPLEELGGSEAVRRIREAIEKAEAHVVFTHLSAKPSPRKMRLFEALLDTLQNMDVMMRMRVGRFA